MVSFKLFKTDSWNESDLEKTCGGKIDLMIFSPPYANQRKSVYGGVSEKEYPEKMMKMIENYIPSLNNTGSIVINIKENCVKAQRSLYVLK